MSRNQCWAVEYLNDEGSVADYQVEEYHLSRDRAVFRADELAEATGWRTRVRRVACPDEEDFG